MVVDGVVAVKKSTKRISDGLRIVGTNNSSLGNKLCKLMAIISRDHFNLGGRDSGDMVQGL